LRDEALELINQPGLAGTRVSHHRNDLPMTVGRLRECALQLLKVALAADEFRQPAPRREIEMAAQRPGYDDFVNVDRFGDSFKFGWSQSAQLEVAIDEPPGVFADDDAIRRRGALHPRRDVDHVADR
jgi:hypothetical protein